MALTAPTTRWILLATLAPVALVCAVFFAPSSLLGPLASVGRVPHDESMSAQAWFGPAVEEVREELGADAALVAVSVYDDRIGVDASVDGGRLASWHFDWKAPEHMRVSPVPDVPAGPTFSARLLDPGAPARVMAAAERRAGGPVSISVLRLERGVLGGPPRWQLHGVGDRGAVTLTASPDGRRVLG
ncbi:MAG TPA: hypothetical protein VIL49_12030 [Capillimicrobium sp.]|jgi:hypothetical protein